MPGYEEQDGDGESGTEPQANEWKDLSPTPDLEQDLGYECREWEQFPVADGSEQVMFLPGTEELLRDDAFVVADDDSLVDLDAWR